MGIHELGILLAEDNDDDVVLIKESLKEAKGIRLLDVVKDGEQAMEYLCKKGRFTDAPRPSLVLLDINMPRKDGFEVLKEIKADPRLKSLPVIMLTTSQREEDIVKSYSDGACSYITKPTTLKHFHEMMKQFETYWTLVAQIPPKA